MACVPFAEDLLDARGAVLAFSGPAPQPTGFRVGWAPVLRAVRPDTGATVPRSRPATAPA